MDLAKLVKKQESSIRLHLDPKILEQSYLIRVDAEIVPYKGTVNRLWLKEIERPGTWKKVTKSEMAKELADLLGYMGYKSIEIDFDFTYYWEKSEDGCSWHDILRAYARDVILTIVH